jgi:hypothetical protein
MLLAESITQDVFIALLIELIYFPKVTEDTFGSVEV